VRDELFGGDDFFALEELDFEIELDFILPEDELFEELLFEDDLFMDELLEDELLEDELFADEPLVLDALLLLLEKTGVIFLRVVLVFLDFEFDVVFGMLLSSFSCFFLISGLVILTLLALPDLVLFVDGA
jgi:hypothetical protein